MPTDDDRTDPADALIDRKLIEHLDGDLDPKCGVRTQFIGHPATPCGDPAVALAVCRRCKSDLYLCSGHYAGAVVLTPARCPKCRLGGTFVFVFEVVPLPTDGDR